MRSLARTVMVSRVQTATTRFFSFRWLYCNSDVFKGIVHVYVPKTTTKWSLQALIRSPVWDNGNFGNDVSVDDERIVVSANAYGTSVYVLLRILLVYSVRN
jgi:hypothetical protein